MGILRLFLPIVIACALAVAPSQTFALNPESPEVVKLVDSGIEFIEANNLDQRLGGKCLAGLALLKYGRPHDHPHIVEAVKACQANGKDDTAQMMGMDIYSAGLVVIFLCELDPSKYHTEIEQYLKLLQKRQLDDGAWTYPGKENGDTSMTQYGVLSAWEAKQAGFLIPTPIYDRAAHWLIATQHSSGGFIYQPTEPNRKNDQPTRPMSSAAVGSLIICAHMMDMIDLKFDPVDENLPPSLRLVEEEEEEKKGNQPAFSVTKKQVGASVARGMSWIRKNFSAEADNSWTYYYLYALERAMSFGELLDGKSDKNPGWYNAGVKFLTGSQAEDGSWRGERTEQMIATPFAVLFLLRSTKKSIEKSDGLGEGTLVGGRGLPGDLSDVKLQRGRIVKSELADSADDLIRILNDPTHPDFDYLTSNADELKPEMVKNMGKNEVEQLEAIIRTGSPDARMAAVRALARLDDRDHAGILIFALKDPDGRVAKEARDGLRFLSRKFGGFGMPDRANEKARDRYAQQWRAWFQTVRPDSSLEN